MGVRISNHHETKKTGIARFSKGGAAAMNHIIITG